MREGTHGDPLALPMPWFHCPPQAGWPQAHGSSRSTSLSPARAQVLLPSMTQTSLCAAASHLGVAPCSGPSLHSMCGAESQDPRTGQPHGASTASSVMCLPQTLEDHNGLQPNQRPHTQPSPSLQPLEVMELRSRHCRMLQPPHTVPQSCWRSRQDPPVHLSAPQMKRQFPKEEGEHRTAPQAAARGDFGQSPAVQAEAPMPWEGALASPPSRSQHYPHWHPSMMLGVTVPLSPSSVLAVSVD